MIYLEVAGIGLSKTGTMSLNEALNMIGYRSKHYPGFNVGEDGSILLDEKDLSGFNAATDLSIAHSFKSIYNWNPNCKFILTVRGINDWADSCSYFFTRIYNDVLNTSTKYLLNKMYGSFLFIKDMWIRNYLEHTNNVVNFFANRKNSLLILDVSKSDAFFILCKFLGKEYTGQVFPHLNKRGSNDNSTTN